MKKANKKLDTRKFRRFLEELSWLISTYSDLDIKKLSDFYFRTELNPLISKNAIGKYESANPNKHFLVGVLPRLFLDPSIFPTNDDIAQFSETVLDVSIPNFSKKSKYEIIGHIVCQTNNLSEYRLSKLVQALERIANGDVISRKLIQKRKKMKYGWNEIIQELANQK